MYNYVLKALESSESSVVITLLASSNFSLPTIGSKRFYSISQTMGSFNDSFLDQAADKLADQALKSGNLLTFRVSMPGTTDSEYVLAAEPFFPSEQLVIFGGGNISYALVKITNLLGYQTVVIDDRQAFANIQRFPTPVKVICEDFERAINKLSLGPWSKVVIVTRGHQHDLACLQGIVEKEIGYIGMIGSRRRVRMIRGYLKEQGITDAQIDRVHMPIGLDIGAETPEEIAVSIAGELIRVSRGDSNQSLSGVTHDTLRYQGITAQDMDLLRLLEEYKQQQDIPVALATIVSSKGSTPRKAGAKILVQRDGRIIGTIGGGCVEGEVRREALNMLDKRKAGLFKFRLDNDVAANEGMACGGTLEVFIEPINNRLL